MTRSTRQKAAAPTGATTAAEDDSDVEMEGECGSCTRRLDELLFARQLVMFGCFIIGDGKSADRMLRRYPLFAVVDVT